MAKQCDQYLVEVKIENEWKKFGGFNTFSHGRNWNIMLPDDFPLNTSGDGQLSPLTLTLAEAEQVVDVLTRPIQFSGFGYPLDIVRITEVHDD